MHPSYDADDFLRRGFLGSFIGFRKRSSSKTEPQLPPKYQSHGCGPAPVQHTPSRLFPEVISSEPSHSSQQVESSSSSSSSLSVPNRTEYDIYREIVSEAELIERSPTTTPISEFSPATTPQPFYAPIQAPIQLPPNFHPSMMHHDPQKLYPPYHMVMTPSAPHPIPVDQNGMPLGGNQCPMAPPPYSNFATPIASGKPHPDAQLMDLQNIPFEVKREIQEHLGANQNGQPVSIEEIVKLVVSALKDSQINESKEESPEDILQRKRIQNNLAAARYRKRQRDAREVAELELGELSRRNDELRDTVAQMEREIAHLKQAVLNR